MRSSNNHSTGKRDIPFLVRSLGWEALKKIVASFAMIVTGHTLQLSPPKKILQNSLCLLTLVIVFFSLRSAFSQITDPWKTFNDTIAYAKANHLVAHVNSSLLPAYQYDNDQGSERIKVGHKTYARTPGGIWKISSDWGQTGSPAANTAQLDFFVTVATSPLQQPVSHDPSQGAHVWQPIDSSSPDREVFVLTREHPRPGGAYPTYTFVREGGIFLISAFAGNLSSSSGLSSLRILYDYFLVTSGASVTPQQSSDSGGTTTSQLGDLTLLENNELFFETMLYTYCLL